MTSGSTIRLEASNNITVSTAFNLSAATGTSNISLVLQANNTIAVNANITTSGTGTLSLIADFDNNGIGSITRGAVANTLIQAAGTMSLKAGSGITASVQSPTLRAVSYRRPQAGTRSCLRQGRAS